MSQQTHLVLQFQDLRVGLRHLVVLLLLSVVIVFTIVVRHHVVSLLQIYLFQHPVKVSDSCRNLKSVLDAFNLSGLIS